MSAIVVRLTVSLSVLWMVIVLLVRLPSAEPASLMLFWVNQHSGFNLHLMDADRHLLVQVVRSPALRVLNPPQLSPDGAHILFELEREGERALFVLDGRGSIRFEQDRRVGIRQPVWSPDGQQIAYWATTDGFWRLHQMALDGSGAHTIGDVVGLVPYTYPMWSPDGNYLLYRIWVAERGSTIFLLNTTTRETHTLTDALSASGDLVWSPDSHRLAYRSARDRSGEIVVLDVESGLEDNLTRHPAVDFQPDWSPDGQELVFVSNRAGQGDLYRMNADGSNLQRITSGGSWRPDWSPGGDRIAFISRRSGRDLLYTIRPDGSDLRVITHVDSGMVYLGWLGEPPRY
jgi:TolB protein